MHRKTQHNDLCTASMHGLHRVLRILPLDRDFGEVPKYNICCFESSPYGLPVEIEAPVMMPNGRDFFFLTLCMSTASMSVEQEADAL